jgi:hypothetical protein
MGGTLEGDRLHTLADLARELGLADHETVVLRTIALDHSIPLRKAGNSYAFAPAEAARIAAIFEELHRPYFRPRKRAG